MTLERSCLLLVLVLCLVHTEIVRSITNYSSDLFHTGEFLSVNCYQYHKFTLKPLIRNTSINIFNLISNFRYISIKNCKLEASSSSQAKTNNNKSIKIYNITDELNLVAKYAEIFVNSSKVGHYGSAKTVQKFENDLLTSGAKLESLSIERCVIDKLPRGILAQCSQLRTLHLDALPPKSAQPRVLRDLLAGASSIRELSITNCYIESIDNELADLINLQILNVSHNQLHYLLRTLTLPSLTNVDLSFNHISSSTALARGLVNIPMLQYLTLESNPFLDFCNGSPEFLDPHSLDKQLFLSTTKDISLKSTLTSGLCFRNMRLSSLKRLDLSNTKITTLQLEELPVSNYTLEINLDSTPITSVQFLQSDYHALREPVKIRGLNLSISCDCEDAWLARAIRENKLVLEGLICNDRTQPGCTEPALLECDKYPCAGACACRRAWSDNAITASCDGTLRTLPNWPGLRAVYAAGNLVETLKPSDFPDTLLVLDLSGNHISRVDETAAEALFKVPDRRVKLAGNPLVCNCDNEAFVNILQTHRVQVEDYNDMRCVDNGPLREVTTEELCKSQNVPIGLVIRFAIVSVFLSVMALSAGIYYRYGQQIKIYLYARGCCLWWVHEEDLDANRAYDAFVSFSHKDEAFVMEEILPKLEREPYNFRLNVHYRNWIPGELIPSQISLSVDQSRRTIIVLSRNFMQSVWALLEFRTAHVSALHEGRVRVIVIVLDDVVDDEDLAEEVRGYLRNNTYVRWGDPWFWDKLIYALPRRR